MNLATFRDKARINAGRKVYVLPSNLVSEEPLLTKQRAHRREGMTMKDERIVQIGEEGLYVSCCSIGRSDVVFVTEFSSLSGS